MSMMVKRLILMVAVMMVDVSVCSGCRNKIPHMLWLKQ